MVAKSRTTRVTRNVACMDEMRSTYRILVETLMEETRRESTIEVCLKEIWCEEVNWIHLAQRRNLWWVHMNM
jgi:hypothetical protein